MKEIHGSCYTEIYVKNCSVYRNTL